MHFVKKTVLGFLVALLCGAAWCGVAANGHAGARRVNHLTRVSSHGRIAVKAEGNRFSESAKVSFSRTRADGVKRRIMEGLAKKRRGGPRLLGAAKEPSSRKEPSVLAMYDISIESDGAKWQPAAGEPVQVDVTLDEPVSITPGATLGVAHLADDGTVEALPASRYSFTYNAAKTAVTAFSFSAEGFSVYTIIETGGIIDSEGTLVKPRRFYHFYYPTRFDGESPVVPSYPYQFKDRAGDVVNVQIIKDGDVLVEPPIPPDVFDEKGELQSVFQGWYVVSTAARAADAVEAKLDPVDTPVDCTWPVGVTMSRLSFTAAVEVTDQADMDYYVMPLYEHARFLQFNENDEIAADAAGDGDDWNDTWRIVQRKLVAINDETKKVTVQVNDVSAALRNSRNEYFCGWRYMGKNGDEQELIVYSAEGKPQNQYVTVDDELFEVHGGVTIQFYPIYVSAHFLNFDTNAKSSGATYVGSLFVRSTSDFSELTPSGNRPGYDFAGWCAGSIVDGRVVLGERITDANGKVLPNVSVTAADGTVAVYTDADGNIRMNRDFTLYASWTANTSASYRVVVWQQRVTDQKDAADADKKYYYVTHYTSPEVPAATQLAESLLTSFTGTRADGVSITGQNLTTLSGTAGGNAANEDFSGFHYSRWASADQTVAADGSTVVNVYYDRNLVTYEFLIYGQVEAGYSETTGTSGTQYGTDNGTDYFEIYYNDGQWYKTRTVVYEYSTEYTGTRYKENGDSYEATDPDDTEGTQYRRTWALFIGYRYYEIYYNKADNKWYQNRTEANSSYSDMYAGTRYTKRNAGNAWLPYKTMTGLYGQTLAQNGYEWPLEYWWYPNGDDSGSASGSRMTFKDAFLPISSSDGTYYAKNVDTSAAKEVRFHKETLEEGSWIQANVVYITEDSFNITDKYNGFTAYQFSNDGREWQNAGTKDQSTGRYSGKPSSISEYLDIRFTRNKYELIFMDGDNTVYETGKVVPYEAPLAEYNLPLTDERLNWGGRDTSAGKFEGWYEDATLTVPFDFTGTMPDGKKFLYAKWSPPKYLVVVDPNGGHLQSGDATWFYLAAGEKLAEYVVTRDYYLDMRNGTHYYHHDIYDPVKDKYSPEYNPSTEGAPRLAYYTEDRNQATDNEASSPDNLYTYSPNAYGFMGWYEVLEDGTLSNDPFSFNDPPNRPVKIRALWRRMGEYTLQYESVDPDGVNEMEIIRDPVLSGDGGYIDEGTTTVAKRPTNYDKAKWVWEGWQVVDIYNNYMPLTTLRSPGDGYIVRAAHADRENIIHFRAVYRSIGDNSSKHIPPVVDLVLDSNENAGLNPESSVTVVEGRIGTYTDGAAGQMSDLNEGVWFAGQMDNFSLPLASYSDKFVHSHGYRLIGWDTRRNCDDLVPEFAANETIGTDKSTLSANVLYAVWEPQVMVKFVNETGAAVTGVTLDVPAWALGEMFRVNAVTGEWAREKFTAFKDGKATFDLAAGETLLLSLPDAADMGFSVSGTSTFEEGEKLVVTRTAVDGATATGTAYPGTEYFVDGVMKVSETPVTVTFTKGEYATKTTVDVRYFLCEREGSGGVTVTEITDDASSWGDPNYKKELEVTSEQLDLAAALSRSDTENVTGHLSAELQTSHGHTTIGVGSATSEEYAEWRATATAEVSGGPYVRYVNEKVEMGGTAYDDAAVYVVFYKLVPMPITVGKSVVGTEADRNAENAFPFTAKFESHSRVFTRTVTKKYTQTRTLVQYKESRDSSVWSDYTGPAVGPSGDLSTTTDWTNPVETVLSETEVEDSTNSDRAADLFPPRNDVSFSLADSQNHQITLFSDEVHGDDPDGPQKSEESTSGTDTYQYWRNNSNSWSTQVINRNNVYRRCTETKTWTETETYVVTYRYETVTITETETGASFTLTGIESEHGEKDVDKRTYTVSSMQPSGSGYACLPSDVVTFTNTRQSSDLVVTKTVVNGDDANEAFDFVVSLDAALVGFSADGVTVSVDGRHLSFSLKNGGEKTLTLPVGIGYTVTEGFNAKYSAASENASGTLGMESVTAAFTNTRKLDLGIAVNDRTVFYNAAEQTGHGIDTVTGIAGGDVSAEAYTVTGLAGGDVLTVAGYEAARGTEAGTYNGSFRNALVKVMRGEEDVTWLYNLVGATPGKLTINVTPIVVTVTGNNATVPYNGEEQTCQGYTYVVTHGGTGEAIANGDIHVSILPDYQMAWRTNVGRSEMLLAADRVDVTVPSGYSVSDKVIAANGYIEITPAKATVKANDCEKILGCSDPALTATVTGLFGDDTVSYTLARESGEAVGTYTITPTVTSSDNPNYVVTPVNGTFTIGTPALIQRANGEAIPIAAGLNDDLLAQFAADAGDAARSWTISSLQDYLNEWQPNGLRRWENFRLGTEKDQQLLDTAAGEGANQLKMGMAEDPKTITDFQYNVRHVLRRYTDGAWADIPGLDPVLGAYPNFANPSFRIALVDAEGNSKSASGFYRVYTQIIPFNREDVVNEIPSPNIIAVLEVNSGLKKTMTAIPWVALPSDPDAAELPSITVNNYVQTGQLSAGDAVYSIDANGIYEKWMLGSGDGQQGALTWTSATTVAKGSSGETVVQDAPDPATHGLSRGAATWVERASEGKPYFLVGQYAPGNITVNIAGGSDTVPASTIIANPSINALPVNSIAWGDNPTTKDTIEVYNDKNICYNLQWNKKKKEWGRSAKVWDETFQAYRSQWQNDFTIPAGTGVRYKRCGGAFTVTVSADQVKETVQSGTGE